MVYRLMEHYTPYQIDLYQVVVGYLLQALGMVVYALGVRKRPEAFRKNLFFTIVLVLEAIVISAGILSDIPAVSLCFGFAMNLLHGIVAGWYLTQLGAFVPQQYRVTLRQHSSGATVWGNECPARMIKTADRILRSDAYA